jgi:hypothetical protein
MTDGTRRRAVLAAVPLALVLVSSLGAIAAGPSKPATPTTSAPKSQGISQKLRQPAPSGIAHIGRPGQTSGHARERGYRSRR